MGGSRRCERRAVHIFSAKRITVTIVWNIPSGNAKGNSFSGAFFQRKKVKQV